MRLHVASAWLLGFVAASCEAPAGPEDPAPRGLLVSVALPLPVDRLDAAHATEYRAALQTIKAAIPEVDGVALFVLATTTPSDWLALLDQTAAEGLVATFGFAAPDGSGDYTGFRPQLIDGAWQLGQLGEFADCAECITHPAFLMLLDVDEPWHGEKRPFYPTADLQSLYARLHELAPGTGLRVMTQFSRELWRQQADGSDPRTMWDAGTADVVQISALEFQDGSYLFELLDQNHFWSRRFIHARTPGIPLWTSVQVFGSKYGPGAGYWFPRERGADQDLARLLDDLVASRYQNEHPLTGIMLQKWDADRTDARAGQWTLGDAYLPGSPAEQVSASQEAIAALNAWLAGR